MPGKHQNAGAEAYPGRQAGEIPQQVGRGGDLADAREVMLDDEQAVIAETVRLYHIIDKPLVPDAVHGFAAAFRDSAAE